MILFDSQFSNYLWIYGTLNYHKLITVRQSRITLSCLCSPGQIYQRRTIQTNVMKKIISYTMLFILVKPFHHSIIFETIRKGRNYIRNIFWNII